MDFAFLDFAVRIVLRTIEAKLNVTDRTPSAVLVTGTVFQPQLKI